MQNQNTEQLKEIFQSFIQLSTRNPSPFKEHPGAISAQDGYIIPPFLGELGIEVLYFLAVIEPWLRNGWKIFARRPEFYPQGTAIANPDLFCKIDEIIQQYNMIILGSGTYYHSDRVMKNLSYNYTNGHLLLKLHSYNNGYSTYANQAHQQKHIHDFYQVLHALLKPYILTDKRPFTIWDLELLAQLDDLSHEAALTKNATTNAMLPSYKPDDFTGGFGFYPPHIGVQFRNLHPNIARNSHVKVLLGAAQKACQIMNLPLLVYGPLKGTIHPPGFIHSHQLADQHSLSLLQFELRALRNCALMFSPESGFADLMGWLQVPCLVEDTVHNDFNLARMNIFQPTMRLLDSKTTLESQIFALMADKGRVGNLPSHQKGLVMNFPAGFANQFFR